MTINVELLRETLEYVTTHRDQWDQSYWLQRTWCGTTACFAGTVALNAGYRPVTSWPNQRNVTYVRKDNEVRSVRDVACELLGLSESQSDPLFGYGATLLELWTYARDLTDGAIEVPASILAEVLDQTLTLANAAELEERIRKGRQRDYQLA
jgi:hypothetical protein